MRNILTSLHRTDKFSLGGGKMVLWAPEFPLWAERAFGFWDHACFLEHRVEPLFTITLLDERLRPLEFAPSTGDWTPARRLDIGGLKGTEIEVLQERTLTGDDVLVARLSLTNHQAQPTHLFAVVWTAPVTGPEATGPWLGQPRIEGGRIAFTRRTAGSADTAPVQYAVAIGADRLPRSWAINLSDFAAGRANHPRWELTPFSEKMTAHGLPRDRHIRGGPWESRANAVIFFGLEYPLRLQPGRTTTFTVGCAIAPTKREADLALDATLSLRDPFTLSAAAWEEWFAGVPQFACSDLYLERAYWYRWFGLRLNAIDTGGRFNLPYPCIYEGVNAGWFRHAISYSAQAHIRELRWRHDPTLAQGSLLNFIAHQRENGSFPGAILTGAQVPTLPGLIYHADWGGAVQALHAIHPDPAFLRQVYEPLSRYAAYFQRERDPEGWGLFDVRNQAETGQEYNSRYLFADPQADQWGQFRLKGVDATVYIYTLFQALAWMAVEVGRPDEAERWAEAAARTRAAVQTRLWDAQAAWFCDVHPVTGERAPARPATGFYPFMTDLAGPEHLPALTRHLLNPAAFWTPYPVPSAALNAPLSSAFGEWKGRRMNCPWNGRSWLMTNSHVCQAFAQAAQRLAPELRPQAAELIRRCIVETFLDGDPARPTSYEYYNPLTGQPPFFRGTDDYMHSWLADLILQFVVGLQPSVDGSQLVVDPLPFGLEHFTVEAARIAGQRVDVTWRAGQGLRLFVDGRLAAHSDRLERIIRVRSPA